MAIENNLKARLQHAVEYEEDSMQHPRDISIPLRGELIFNKDLNNFKVGDGEHNYGNLNEFLASVAISGSYNDLSNKPTIPAAQIQSDWNQTDNAQKDFIKNKPTIPSTTDTWTFTLANGNIITKRVYISND